MKHSNNSQLYFLLGGLKGEAVSSDTAYSVEQREPVLGQKCPFVLPRPDLEISTLKR